MPNGGTLTIRSSNRVRSAEAARHPDARPGKYVVVEVADKGTGMPPEVKERATEPFFTTKEAGHGTGLGLSQVYGFVRQSDGFLTIDSAPGAGTKITHSSAGGLWPVLRSQRVRPRSDRRGAYPHRGG